MKIRIIDETSDGVFTVGKVYDVEYVYAQVVFVADNKGDIHPVYGYEFEWVEV